MPVDFTDLFPRPKPVIAMIHTGPAPGMPDFSSIEALRDRAVAEADLLVSAGVDGLIIENMHDFPCIHEREMGPEVAAYMTRVATAVKRHVPETPIGIQVLFQANKTALAVALGAGCDFVRAEGWTYAHISDKGIAEACAGAVIRYRCQIGADHIPVFADIKKKHAAHTWTADITIEDVARSMDLHRADGVIVTGFHTGDAPDLEEVRRVRAATSLPLLIGSGVNPENAGALAAFADGFIVGSSLKEGGVWHAPVSEERVVELLAAVEEARAAVASP
jgi:uncharacterized protein